MVGEWEELLMSISIVEEEIIAQNNTQSESQQQIGLEEIFAPIIQPLASPMFIGYFGLMVLLAMLSVFSQGSRKKISDVRWVSGGEIRAGKKRGRKQIRKQKPNEIALEFERGLVLGDLQPAMAVVGKSRIGKTRSVIDPGIKSGIDQDWTMFVLDVKGNLMKKHAAYALSKGYDCYVYAPGFEYSDGLNFLDFMEDASDAKAAYEMGRVLEQNFGEPGARKDSFFSPQGIALLKTVFMLAKDSPFPDLLSAFKFLTLPNLAKRIESAQKEGYFNDVDINSWIGDAAVGLRAVADSPPTSAGIVGTATTHFQNLVDKSIIPCLLKSTIPLDLTGKQIVFFQIDEEAKAATSPLVAMAIHMLMVRNLNAKVKRDRPLGVILDEFTEIKLPDAENFMKKNAEYGMLMMLGYQSDSQLIMKYTREEADAMLANCSTKMIFNTGHLETARKYSQTLGEKDDWFKTQSISTGKNRSTSTAEHWHKIPLMSGDAIERMGQGKCIIRSPCYKYRPRKLKVRINKKNDRLWSRCEVAWDKRMLPVLRQQFENLLKDTTLEVEKLNRQTMAEVTLPSKEEIEALNKEEEVIGNVWI